MPPHRPKPRLQRRAPRWGYQVLFDVLFGAQGGGQAHVINSEAMYAIADEEGSMALMTAWQLVKCSDGQVLIQQGDVGDWCYIVESGSFDVKARRPETARTRPNGLLGRVRSGRQIQANPSQQPHRKHQSAGAHPSAGAHGPAGEGARPRTA